MDNKIKLFVSSPENQYLERKSARVEPFDILKHLVAFANADGGSLVIGVEDNGEVTGFNTSKAHKIEEFKNIALTKLKDSPIAPCHGYGTIPDRHYPKYGYERGERPQRCNGHVCPPYDCFPL